MTRRWSIKIALLLLPAVAAALLAYPEWRRVAPAERAKILRRIAQIVRDNAHELALIDALDGGSPVHEMLGDVANAASQLDFFAGLVTEMKGSSVPQGPDSINFSVREPRGVIGRTETLKYQAILGENRPADWPDKAKVYEGFGKDDAQWEWWLAYHRLMTAA